MTGAATKPRGPSVLIVDDSPVMRAFIRRVLSISGMTIGRVLEASDGEQALALLRREHVDLTLSDINMPNMDGAELMRNIAADPALSRIPVIVVSTDSSQHRTQAMLDLGAAGYVQKPFQPESLRAELEHVLGGC